MTKELFADCTVKRQKKLFYKTYKYSIYFCTRRFLYETYGHGPAGWPAYPAGTNDELEDWEEQNQWFDQQIASGNLQGVRGTSHSKNLAECGTRMYYSNDPGEIRAMVDFLKSQRPTMKPEVGIAE